MRDPHEKMDVRITLLLLLAEAVPLTMDEPETTFEVIAIPCPGCHRHSVGFSLRRYIKGEQKPRGVHRVCLMQDGRILQKKVEVAPVSRMLH
jgi:hypothetical protein